jgi:LssY C-terminus
MYPAKRLTVSFFTVLIASSSVAAAEEVPSSEPPTVVIKSGTAVKLQFSNTISSAKAHQGDKVDFVVQKDLTVDGYTVVRAGEIAHGSVVEVERKRLLGVGGRIIVKLDSVEMANGERVGLEARQRFKGKSHTLRMGLLMAATAAIYLPAAPVFLLAHGRDSVVLKGTEVTAYTTGDVRAPVAALQSASLNASELPEMVKMLPGRVLNGEGREGDMLNVIFAAKEEDLREAFARAGWVSVEKSHPQIIWHLLCQRTRYTKLPMDRLYLFGRPQDYSYALPEPGAVVAQRHHLRIWKTSWKVDGVPLWVGAATHDVGIEFVTRKFWVFHRIDPNVDAERDFIAGDLEQTTQLTRHEYVTSAEGVSGAETATGQAYYSDNRMLFIGLGPSPERVATDGPAGREAIARFR